MIKVANVDMENYAKSAGRILSTNRDIYIKAAVKILSCGYGSAHADVLIRQKVVDAIRRELFQKVQREGIVSAYTTGSATPRPASSDGEDGPLACPTFRKGFLTWSP